MFILNATNKSLVAVLAGAVATNQPVFFAAYGDATDTALTEACNAGNTNSTTEVTVVAAPAASTRRVIRNLTVYNADTAAITVTVSLAIDAARYPLFTFTLAAGATWDYLRSIGAGGEAHNRAHNLLSTDDHPDVGDYLDQAVRTTDTPEFDGLDLTGDVWFESLVTALLMYQRCEASGTPTADGWRMRYQSDYFGGSKDALIFEKCDGNDADPDGGFAWTMQGNDGVISEAFAILSGYLKIHGGYLKWATDHFEYSANGSDWTEFGTGTGGAGAAENVIRNWQFNGRHRTTAQPDFWDLEGTPTLAYDTAEAGWGSKSLKITGAGATDEGVAQTLKLKASTTYTVHARVKVTAGDTLNLVTTGGASDVAESSTSDTWETIFGQVTTDSTPTDIVVKLTAAADGDEVWVGAVWVTETAAAVNPTPGRGWEIWRCSAGSFEYPTANPAPLATDTGVNGTIRRHLMDDTTQEYVLSRDTVPAGIDVNTSVLIVASGYAVTAAADKFIQLSFEHSARGAGETWDDSYTAQDSGDIAISADQDKYDYAVWPEAVTWEPGARVRWRLSRKAPSGTNLTGDWGLTDVDVLIPTLGVESGR